jgi:hypothetical protein
VDATAFDIAEDILRLNISQVSRLYDEVDDKATASYTKQRLSISREQVRLMHKGAYLIRKVEALAPSFPAALKMVEKAGKHLPQANMLSCSIFKSLFDAICVNESHTQQHMRSVWQMVKVDGRRLVRAIESNKAAEKTSYKHQMLLYAMTGLEVNQDTMPLHVCSLLFFPEGAANIESLAQATPVEEFRQMATHIFSPIFASSWGPAAKASSEAIRLVKKHSRPGSEAIGYLYAMHSMKDETNQGVPLSAEGAAFSRQLMDSQGIVKGMIKLIVSQAMNQFNPNRGVEFKTSIATDSISARLTFVFDHANKLQFDAAIISAFRSAALRIRFIPENPGAMDRFGDVVDEIIGCAHEKAGCWWSILNAKEGLTDYMSLSKGKNSILRSAIEVLMSSTYSGNFYHAVAAKALLRHYDEKSINLLLHNSANPQKTMAVIYSAVGDRAILEKMSGATKKTTLMSELGL